MEEFLPSEVARAVYGYLISEGCEEAAKVFLETSPNLIECKQLVKKGKNISFANTSLLGRTLAEVLNIGCTVHSLVRQANEKRSTNKSEKVDEGWIGLFDQLRSFILAETVGNLSKSGNNSNLELNFNFPQSLSGLRSENEDSVEPQVRDSNSQELNTPKRPSSRKSTPSKTIAEDYRSLVEECQEGLDLSLSSSPKKTVLRNLESIQNRPSLPPSTLETTGFGEDVEFGNQAAAAAATGGSTQPPQFTQVPANNTNTTHQVPVSTQPLPAAYTPPVPFGSTDANQCSGENVFNVFSVASSMQPLAPISTNFVPTYPETATVSSLSQPIISPAPFPGNNFNIDGINRLPDPPIILLDNQNQPMMQFDANDPSFFNIGPCAASTPHPVRSVPPPPEDTAIIIYPPKKPVRPQNKKNTKPEKKPVRSSARLRRILPRPELKVVHVNVLPQEEDRLEEEEEDNPAEVTGAGTNNDLATELPNLNEDPPDGKTETLTVNDSATCVEPVESMNQNECSTSKKSSDGKEISPEKFQEKSNESSKEKGIKTPKLKPPTLRKHISRSTPRRNSHVRALSFNTPNKPPVSRKANTSPKIARSVFSPRTSKLNNVKRAALFKSPTSPKNVKELSRLTEEDESEAQDASENSPLKVPIATRSPAPKLSSAWKEVNDVTITPKPQWDDKIRSFMTGNFVDPAPPPKSKSAEKKGSATSKTNNQTKSRPHKTSIKRQSNTKALLKSSKAKNKSLKPRQTPKKTSNDITKKSPVKICTKTSDPCISVPKKNSVNKNKKAKSAFLLSDTSSSSDVEDDDDDDPSTVQRSPVAAVTNTQSQDTTQAVEPTVSEIATRNILLDDLVLSSNSNFPLTDATTVNANEIVKISEPETVSVLETSNALKKKGLESKETDSTEQVSPKFALPNIPVQETPLKEFHKIVPLTPILNTPFLNTIRRETSILEDDLLLTPSLPPTPQVNSPCHPSKTPSKSSPHTSSSQKTHNLPQIVTKSTRSPVAVPIENKEIASPKRNIISSGDKSVNPENILDKAHTENCDASLKVKGVLPSSKLSDAYQQQISTSSKEDQTSTTSDSSEEELHSNRPELPKVNIPPIKTRILQGDDVIPKSKIQQNPKTNIYTTTDTSDSGNDASYVPVNKPKSDNMSKLTKMLLENERRRLEKLSKQTSGKKKKPSTNQLNKKETRSKQSFIESKKSHHLHSSTPEEKNEQKIGSKGKFPTISLKKKNSSKLSTPEKKMLQNELLKQTRKEIYGDESFYPSSSDSESDKSIFEPKQYVVKSQVVAKAAPKKVITKDKEVSSEDSPEKLNKGVDKSKSIKCDTVESTNKCIIPKSTSLKDQESKRNHNQSCKNLKSKSNQLNIKSTETISSTVRSPSHSLVQSSQMMIFQEENANKDISSAKNLFLEQNLPLEKGKSDDPIGTEDVSSTVDENISEHVLASRNSSVESEQSFKSSESISCKPSSSVSSKNKKPPYNTALEPSSKQTIEEKDKTRVGSSSNFVKESSRPFSQRNCQQSRSIEVSKENADSDKTKTMNEMDKKTCSASFLSQTPIGGSSNTSKLDLSYKYQFDADDKLVTLSVSEYSFHLVLPSNVDSKLNHPLDIQSCSRQNNTIQVNPGPSKSQNAKRRVKLTPVHEDKYEQKLQIDYDVVDGKVISQRRDRKLSGDSEYLEVSCSTIDADSVSEVVSRKGLQSVKKVDFASEFTALKTNSIINNETRNRASNQVRNASKMLLNDDKQKDISEQLINDPQPKTYSKLKEEKLPSLNENQPSVRFDGDAVDCKRMKERNKGQSDTSEIDTKTQTSQLDRRKSIAREDRETYNKSFQRSDRRRYSRDRSNEDSRRRYSERRRRSPPARSEREDYRSGRQKYLHSDRDTRRYRSHEKNYPTNYSSLNNKRETDRRRDTERRRYSRQTNSRYEDVDNVDVKEPKQSAQSVDTYTDPRAQLPVTYSDIEKESSTDEAPSLMDYAILKKSSKKRVSFRSPLKSTEDDAPSERFGHPSSAKRKAPTSAEEFSDVNQAAKKLKLGEVDMEQAKNVIEQKTIGALLDKLHPDTSNEATGS